MTEIVNVTVIITKKGREIEERTGTIEIGGRIVGSAITGSGRDGITIMWTIESMSAVEGVRDTTRMRLIIVFMVIMVDNPYLLAPSGGYGEMYPSHGSSGNGGSNASSFGGYGGSYPPPSSLYNMGPNYDYSYGNYGYPPYGSSSV